MKASTILEDRTARSCFGVVPYFTEARKLPQEDAMALDYRARGEANAGRIKIAVPRLARIANFDDLDPLAAEPDVALEIIDPGAPLPLDADMVLIPGSKATLADLGQIRDEGWDIDILALHRRGATIVGLCAGYQILGHTVADPDGTEGPPGEAPGLGLLDITTVLGGDKALVERAGRELASGEAITGYEMHIGETTGAGTANPLVGARRRSPGRCAVRRRPSHGVLSARPVRRRRLPPRLPQQSRRREFRRRLRSRGRSRAG